MIDNVIVSDLANDIVELFETGRYDRLVDVVSVAVERMAAGKLNPPTAEEVARAVKRAQRIRAAQGEFAMVEIDE